LFVVLATSAIAVYAPILMTKVMKLNAEGIVFTIVKQFGTGIIIATSLVHVSGLKLSRSAATDPSSLLLTQS
jgi:zinc transporter 1/2/3